MHKWIAIPAALAAALLLTPADAAAQASCPVKIGGVLPLSRRPQPLLSTVSAS